MTLYAQNIHLPKVWERISYTRDNPGYFFFFFFGIYKIKINNINSLNKQIIVIQQILTSANQG